ncbi:beta-2 adrenergic receptor-like [Micropterus salmoides]|uniref:beta-2 adrenergic receptor-like n=1 Tax=Micropterus salmoides TaxID=27706 RepID=UPI0018EAAD37|nr:beta-2 adrenergic receptor-like [Micropterus salmoides]XP_038557481.1 beta-2 adrenergic receptor-like [Micropterus salmoides]XP_038557482.1 beta-2 adrenergic receptor-like [Micropterus salmoides]XP_038557483.1 beta-2 adrenergic receptor-like [Micropterus salmoides]XP_038557484.1 beta-2 adrenergic receptor-like [Micropterus salmoides]XP_038557485.1 beta-2 adrenergic receptor-like [Micropterus salmoides]XP_038557486.1 beta-2 adrenergic receptor-like [Micropterus salmoides]
MTALLPNVSVPGSTAVLLPTTDYSFNLTAVSQAGLGSGQSLAPLCTLCCCGFLNRTLAVVFMVSLAFAIVVGNVVTLTVFVQTRQSRTPQGYLKVSLAMADMMVGVLVVPFSVYTEISLMVTSAPPIWYQGSSTSLATSSSHSGQVSPWQPCMLIGPVFAGCTFVSISTIFLMTLERSVAILRPLHKDALVTRRRTLLLILLSWAASFLLALAPLIFSSNFTLEYNECSRMCNYTPLLFGSQLPPDANILLLFPAFDFTLLGGTLAVNIVSFTSIRRYTRKRKLLSEGSLSDGGGQGGGSGGGGGGGGGGCPHRPSFSDIKAAKTIGILTFAFTASFSPIAVFVLGNVVGYTWCNFSFFAFWILTGNSCCNVIIYSVRDHRFRKGVTLLFQREQSPPHGEKT